MVTTRTKKRKKEINKDSKNEEGYGGGIKMLLEWTNLKKLKLSAS